MTSDYKPTAGKLHGAPVPARSFVLVWEGMEPKVKPSHWEVGYTPAHQANPDLAIAYAMQQHVNLVDEVKQKWLKLNVLAAEHVADAREREADFIEVIRTPDMNERLVMPEMENAPRIDQPTDIMADDEQYRPTDIKAYQNFLKENYSSPIEGYDDHQDH